MNIKNSIQIWFDDVMCYVDIETKQVYSAKFKLLKGLKHARTPVPYYIIHYNGHKSTKSINQLLRLANEKLQSKNTMIS